MEITQQGLKALCLASIDTIKEAAIFIKTQAGRVQANAIEEKSLNSLVSYVDKEAEKILVNGLGKLLPTATFHTEEDTIENQDSEIQWIIDPLDGTTNFLFQLPIYSVSVALKYRGELILGIIHEVNRNECFYAWKNGGAFLNDTPIKVSTTSTLEKSLLATGFPYYKYDTLQKYFSALEAFMLKSRGIRRLGSAAVDLAYVACGRFDIFFESDLQLWDVAAGIILIREAGGKVTTYNGDENVTSGKEILATNGIVHDQGLAVIKSAFYSGL